MNESSHATRSYRQEAQRVLKDALWARGLTYRTLASLLTQDGAPHTKENLINKVSRGTFSAAFFVQCLALIGKVPSRSRSASSSFQDCVP
jgi:hypothetical protein